MNLDALVSQLAREAVDPMLAEHFERLERLIDDLVQRLGNAPAPLLKTKDVAAYLRVSLRTVERMVAAGEFPPPIRLGENSLRWRRSDLDGWLEGRRSAS